MDRIKTMIVGCAVVLMVAGADAQVVISEVYGGGGNSGAAYRNDFVELFNRGSSSTDISNWSVQYASAAGTTWSVTSIPAGTVLQAGQNYLVQLASGGSAGAFLPAPDRTGTTNMSATSGKVILCSVTTAQTGACPTGAAIVDKVGFGTANCSEGAATGVLSASSSAQRNGDGCDDSNANSADFTVATPVPQNSAGTVHPCGSSGSAVLRICTWNVTSYTGADATRDAAFKTAAYSTFSGRTLAPDVIAAQEFSSQSAVDAFRTLLNTAAGSPGDWASAAFIDGTDLDNVFFYRTSKVIHIGTTTIAVGSTSSSNQPRNTYRHDFRPIGLIGNANTIAVYNSHMKAGSTSSDQSRRLVEAQRIRDNAEGVDTNPSNGVADGLPAGYNFMVVGDFNIQTSTQAAYQELIGSQANNSGRFFDPINTPGSWNNNASFAIVHTQEPKADMDDRLDFILLSASLKDGAGIDYVGDANAVYSTSTWNDPNHSYRVWGNDGTSYGLGIKTSSNTMVGGTIAQALKDSIGSGATGGHLPVYLELSIPGGALMADANSDGVVDSLDLLTELDWILMADPAGDINGDGSLDETDLLDVIEKVLAAPRTKD